MGSITDDTAENPTSEAKLVERLSALGAEENKREEIISILDTLTVALRNDAIRIPLGQTELPQILVDLSGEEDDELLRQVGRVAANLVIDCDANRNILVKAGYVDSILSHPIFQLPARSAPASAVLAITASLHNLTVDKNESAIKLLKQELHLRTIIDFTHRWTEDFYSSSPLDETITIARWAWSIMASILEDPPSSLPFNTISTLLLPISSHAFDSNIDIDSHLHILTHSCNTLDSCITQANSSRTDLLEHLGSLTDFVEKADVPNQTEVEDEGEDQEDDDEEDFEKRLGKAKAATVRGLVDLSTDVPITSSFWNTMRRWLDIKERSDLLNCALLTFGNSVKDDESAKNLVQGDESLLPKIIPLLSPSTPAMTQHSVIGLMKNLSVARDNQDVLGKAGVIEKLYEMGVWSEKTDMLGSVQGGAAGIVKNLCRSNASNSSRFLVLPLDPLLDLIKRVDDPALKFECTRVFVNVIKSLAIAQKPVAPVGDARIIDALAKMLVDGEKYPVLQSESVIALTLLATFGGEDINAAVELSLEGKGGDIIRKMGEDPRKEIRENANTLLKAIQR
uniref:ARM repeat-containing protein n=1 Tax=Kwoniella pini CBS 10737 TaxID=1296096 RepID=A0A1B9I144_9TREE|nr:uncharacterized protein I206_04954 [Kwoniella pini CBS 10737]OCF49266.1 hypothetical protein I206_04954 [Kwoniella pini CBS 10737]